MGERTGFQEEAEQLADHLQTSLAEKGTGNQGPSMQICTRNRLSSPGPVATPLHPPLPVQGSPQESVQDLPEMVTEKRSPDLGREGAAVTTPPPPSVSLARLALTVRTDGAREGAGGSRVSRTRGWVRRKPSGTTTKPAAPHTAARDPGAAESPILGASNRTSRKPFQTALGR